MYAGLSAFVRVIGVFIQVHGVKLSTLTPAQTSTAGVRRRTRVTLVGQHRRQDGRPDTAIGGNYGTV